jgi:hypothetical protein
MPSNWEEFLSETLGYLQFAVPGWRLPLSFFLCSESKQVVGTLMFCSLLYSLNSSVRFKHTVFESIGPQWIAESLGSPPSLESFDPIRGKVSCLRLQRQ